MDISDWKTIQTRNDIKYIKQKIDGSNVANWSIAIDVFLVLLGFVFDNTLGDNTSNAKPVDIGWIWVIIGIVGTLVPITLLAVQTIRKRNQRKRERHVMNVKNLVPLFDDELCYAIMSAETFYATLIEKSSSIANKQVALMQEFLYIETSYYLSKSVKFLLRMEGNLPEVLEENPGRNYISKTRMINVINLIDSLYNSLIEYVSSQSATLGTYSIVLNEEKARYMHGQLVKLVNTTEVLGITLQELPLPRQTQQSQTP